MYRIKAFICLKLLECFFVDFIYLKYNDFGVQVRFSGYIAHQLYALEVNRLKSPVTLQETVFFRLISSSSASSQQLSTTLLVFCAALLPSLLTMEAQSGFPLFRVKSLNKRWLFRILTFPELKTSTKPTQVNSFHH